MMDQADSGGHSPVLETSHLQLSLRSYPDPIAPSTEPEMPAVASPPEIPGTPQSLSELSRRITGDLAKLVEYKVR
jgi:hypothetical protein